MNNEDDCVTTKQARRSATILWVRLARVFQKLDRVAVEQMRSQDLSLAQFDVLAQVGSHEGLTQQELADHLLVTKGNVSQLVEKMDQRGLVRRSAQGRTMRLWLTPEGHALYTRCIPPHEELLARQFAVLNPKERQQLRTLLTKLDHNLK
jgi:DNA-binding MarR family transcriptional regulator